MYKFYDKAWQDTDTNKNKGEEQKIFVQGKIIWNHFSGENSSPLTYLASDLALLEHHEDFVSCPLKKKKSFFNFSPLEPYEDLTVLQGEGSTFISQLFYNPECYSGPGDQTRDQPALQVSALSAGLNLQRRSFFKKSLWY